MQKIIQKVIIHYSKQKDTKKVCLTRDAISHLIKFSVGDARTLINALEMAIETNSENDVNEIKINLSIAEDAIQKKNIVYDKNGQNHYDVISAFIKSIRGSDPDATWIRTSY